MVQTEELDANVMPQRHSQWARLLTLFFRPAKTLRAVLAEERSVWVLPLLVLTVLTLVYVGISGPLRQQAAAQAPTTLPDNFQYMSPEQQQQYLEAQQSGNNFITTTVFPAIGALAGLWAGWFVLGGVLHLAMTLLGSRSNTGAAYNLAAWASMPFALRLIVQILYLLISQKLISASGLSGFIAPDAAGIAVYFRAMLMMVDLYLIWQLVLLAVGAAITPGLTRSRALFAALIAIVVVLALGALPGFGMAQLSGLNVIRSFIF